LWFVVLEEQLLASHREVGEACPQGGPLGGTTSKVWPPEPGRELASLGDSAAAVEAAAVIMKTKVVFMDVTRSPKGIPNS
jgi:hypothetical protein